MLSLGTSSARGTEWIKQSFLNMDQQNTHRSTGHCTSSPNIHTMCLWAPLPHTNSVNTYQRDAIPEGLQSVVEPWVSYLHL